MHALPKTLSTSALVALALAGAAPAATAATSSATAVTTSENRRPAQRLSNPRIGAHFDLARNQTPENLAVEPDGDVDVSLSLSRQVVRVTPTGRTRVLATLPAPADGGVRTPAISRPIVTGVARSSSGTLYFLYAAGDSTLTGLWQLRPGAQPHRIAALPATSFPNGLVLDHRSGSFFVADSALATIWRIPGGGGAPTAWATGAPFAPTAFIGANGLELHDGALWSSNTDQGTILRTPFTRGGAVGTTRTRARDLTNVDDFDFTGRGDQLVAALNGPNQVVLVQPDGSHTTALDGADGLQNPSAVAVRHGVVYVNDAGLHTGEDPNLLLADLGR